MTTTRSLAGSAELLERAEQVAPGGVHTSIRRLDPQINFSRAQGAYVYDVDGNEYIDYQAAFGPIVLGHCYPAVNNAVIDMIQNNDLFGVGATEYEIALASKVVEHVPSAEKVLFCNAGSEATYHAIRVSRAITGRKLIIKFQGCYHGWHGYVLRNGLSAPDKVGKRDPGSAGMLDEEIDSTLVCTFNDLADVQETVAAHPEQVAAIILEPIPHNIGCVMPKQEFLEGLRTLCDEQGIVLIFDEVITGFRHGIGGYQAVCGVTPDLTTMGKAMANGFPMAAVAGKAEYMDHFNTNPGGNVFFAGTYNGHAGSVAAALATIAEMETGKVFEHIFRLGDRMRDGLRKIVNDLDLVWTVAGFGSVYTLYFMDGPAENYTDLLRNDENLYVRYRQGLNDRGIFELPMNLKRNHISYSHTEADIDRTLEAAEEVLRELSGRN
ncbi:MAG: aspartate aminotransferase family protein [Thermomicrobiales bacterium]